MDPLPTEIFNEIIRYLHQEHKVNCMLVCHQWKNIIDSFTLFHTIRISTLDSLEKITKKLQKDSKYCTQVERLAMLTRPGDRLTKLLLMLPNLRALYVYSFGQKMNIEDGVQFPFVNNIKNIVEHSKNSMARSMLTSTPCVNLTTLAISDLNDSDVTMLEYAPALRNLTLDLGDINLERLEFIHEKLPLLESIKLISMDIKDQRYFGQIKPAPLITEGLFQYIEFEGNSQQYFFEYITKKYPNISKFTFINDAVMTESDAIAINNHGWKPLFEKLGSKLKSVSIRQQKGLIDVIEMMDESDCKLNSLNLSSTSLDKEIHKLGQSNQAKYIKSLTLEDIRPAKFRWLQGLKSLTELNLIASRLGEPLVLKINDVLKRCSPMLKSFSLENVELTFDIATEETYKLEILSMELVTFPEGMDTFISKCLPQLSRLELMRCKLEGRTFNIMTSKLSTLYIAEDFRPKTKSILIFTLANNQKHWYTAKRDGIYIAFHVGDTKYDDIGLYPSTSLVPANDIDVLPFFTLLCHSVKNVHISNYPFSILDATL